MTDANNHEVDQNQALESLNWGPDSPKGGRVVMGRILKESATVPLFFGQTIIQSLQDMAYNDTTSALCEHVYSAIQRRSSANEAAVHDRRGDRTPLGSASRHHLQAAAERTPYLKPGPNTRCYRAEDVEAFEISRAVGEEGPAGGRT